MSANFSWETIRKGNEGFVTETFILRGTVHKKVFGPMAAHTVPAFVKARRIYVAMRMNDLGHISTPVDENSDVSDVFDPTPR